MNNLKLEDGMELTVIPLPFDSDKYFFEYNLIYDDVSRRYVYINPNSMIDINIYSVFKKVFFEYMSKLDHSSFMDKYKAHTIKRYFVYVLYNNELYITNFGIKLKQKLEEYSYNKDFKFRKMNIQIRMMGSFPNYDYTTVSNDYYGTKYKDLNDYLCSLGDDDYNYIPNILNRNSCSNPKNHEVMSDIFNRLELTDFKLYLRQLKINSIKEKIC